jgi:pSer/pThr/pTyr-binding forkhead associated (FHA) protein
MNASGARLIIRHGSGQQQELELTGETTVLGREAINDIVLHDPEVSRRHAQITYQGGRYIIEDLGSTNGTFVNNRRISVPTWLNNGDLIEMGESLSITFQRPETAMDETVVKPELIGDPDKTVADVEAIPGVQAGAATSQPQYDSPPLATSYEAASQQIETGEYTGPQESLPPPPTSTKNRNRFLIGCGCLAILLIIACATSVFLLDALAPDFLYCDLGGPIFNAFGVSLACP